MRLSLWCLAGVSILSACSGYAPQTDVTGATRDEIVARMGPPETVREVDGGTRLEFPRGPYGRHTWFIDLDGTGRAVRTQQVLTEAHFSQIVPGMGQDEVRRRLGRPGDVEMLGRSRGIVWSYRYENAFCQWFQVEISEQQQVRSAGYGEPPECQKREPALPL